MSWTLVADIGGTNARLAAVIHGVLQQPENRPTISEPDIETGLFDILSAFVAEQGSRPEAAVVAAAGIVADRKVRLTNTGQKLAEADLAALTQSGFARIINDFEAAAWSLRTIARDDIQAVQGPSQAPTGNRVIIGPGTGLGVGALLSSGADDARAVPGEGGHVGISPECHADAAVFEAYSGLCSDMVIGSGHRLEAEAFCSGTGLPTLYRAVCEVDGVAPRHQSNAAVLDAVATGDKQSSRTAELFTRYLARVAGDLALVFAAHGGVFFTGGIVLSNAWLLDRHFLRAFNDGGRYTAMRAGTPVYLYTQEQFGLIGARNSAASAKL